MSLRALKIDSSLAPTENSHSPADSNGYEVGASDVSPATGIIGDTVVITGTNLWHVAQVLFGEVAAEFTIDGSTQITAIAPVVAVGTVDVVLVTVFGGHVTQDDAFEFTSAVGIDSITPDHGSVLGGTAVTVVLSQDVAPNVASITFDGNPGTGLAVVNPRTLSVVTPAGAAVSVIDVVVDAGAFGNDTAAGGYSYDSAVTVASVTPNHGLRSGGTLVTISGTGFLLGDMDVHFHTTLAGDVAAEDVVVVNNTTITCTSPSVFDPAAGEVVVDGGELGSASAAYTFEPLAAIDSIVPATGPAAGGTAVTISGHGLTGTAVVLFDGAAANDLVVVNDNTITCTSPESDLPGAGPVDISINGGVEPVFVSGGFEYV